MVKEMDFYVDEYARHGVHGPRMLPPSLTHSAAATLTRWAVNWYRTREANHQAELEILKTNPKGMIDNIPVLFILATRDTALKPAMSANMHKYIPLLTKKQVVASHWALWEKPAEVNGMIREWLIEQGVAEGGSKSKL